MISKDSPEQRAQARRKRGRYLLLVGGGLLLLPLAGVTYIYIKGAHFGVLPAVSSFTLFQKHHGAQPPARPAAGAPAMAIQKSLTAPTPASPSRRLGGSLDFIRGGSDYDDNSAAKPQAQGQSAPRASAAQIQSPPPANPRAGASASRKSFYAPKLQSKGVGTGSFYNTGTAPAQGAEAPPPSRPAQNSAAAAPQAEEGQPDISELMKNMPQDAGMPDINQLMKNMPQQTNQGNSGQ